MYGHANAAGAVATGAASVAQTPAFGVNPPVLESFSSAGPTRILFDTDGARLATPIIRQKPEIVAPDGGNTTFFSSATSVDADFFPNFFGTSAAAPHAAGVAALLLEQRRTLAPFSIYSVLQGTAINMGPAGFDFDSGFGLIQADAALRCVAASAGQARDFDGNCKADILWRHTSGSVYLWQMDGTAVTGAGGVGGADNGWTIEAVGDFDGDGRTDILWRNTSGYVYLWLMDGTSVVGTGSPGSPDGTWTIEGAGDVNGDGTVDILWPHTSGTVYLWLMDGISIIGTGSPGSGVGPSEWTVQGLSDFKGDGKADVLWRHTSGLVRIWLMNGTVISSTGDPSQRRPGLEHPGGQRLQWRRQGGCSLAAHLRAGPHLAYERHRDQQRSYPRNCRYPVGDPVNADGGSSGP